MLPSILSLFFYMINGKKIASVNFELICEFATFLAHNGSFW